MMKAMTLNDLNNVTGGSIYETYEDGKVLAGHGYIDGISLTDLIFHWVDYSRIVDNAWMRAAGVTSVTKPFGSNQYFNGTKEITREQAFKMIKD